MMKKVRLIIHIIYLAFYFVAFLAIQTVPSSVSARESEASVEVTQLQWNRTFGTSGQEFVFSTLQTLDGGYAIVGRTSSWEAWLIKLDQFGNVEWNRTYSRTSGRGLARRILQTSDEGFLLAGGWSQDAWLIKTDEFGNVTWNKTFGSSVYEDQVWAVCETVGGYFFAGVTLKNKKDFWLVKIARNGSQLWSQTYGGIDDEVATALIPHEDGGFIIAGSTTTSGATVLLIKTDELGQAEWNQTYIIYGPDQLYSAARTNDDGYIMVGQTELGGVSKAWIIRTNAMGEKSWDKTYPLGSLDSGAVFSVKPTGDAGYILAGFLHPHSDVASDLWLVKLYEGGNIQWSRVFGGSGFESNYAASVIPTDDGGFLVACDTENGSDYDILVLKTDSNGIIPEFPSFVIPALLIMVSTLVAIVYKRRL